MAPVDDKQGLLIADLPGLIEEAHRGKGLGRMFLRHVRRTRLLLHVIDVSSENPVADFVTVRKELQLYNPEYLARPHVIALNKMDVVASEHQDLKGYIESSVFQSLHDAILRECYSSGELPPIVPISAKERVGVDNLLEKVITQLVAMTSKDLPANTSTKKGEREGWDPSWDNIDLDSIP